MIRSIRSNNASFKSVEFTSGYNIILADRKKAAGKDDKKNTRNGAGKTTLIEIIHFCLGAQAGKKSIFKSEHLKGWSFTLSIDIDGQCYELERETDVPNRIYIYGNIEHLNWDLKFDKKLHKYYLSPGNLNNLLLELFFGIERNQEIIKYAPSFRELISYSIRRTTDGYRNAFEYFPKQKAYSLQACNSYFLELNMEYASGFQELKDKIKGIDDYKKAAKSGVIGNFTLNLGELNTEVIMRQKDANRLKEQLDSFQVHPQYSAITKEANELTDSIHQCTNTLALRKQLLERYEASAREETNDVPLSEIEQIYAEAGIVFGDAVIKSINEVLDFHKAIISNRKEYLHSEIQRLRREIINIESEIKSLCLKRSNALSILETHGALEEYTQMQERYTTSKQLYEDAKKRLESAEYIENSKSKLKIDNQELLIKSRQDYIERISTREKAVSIFKANTEFLYPEAGTLTIDLKETGYTFGVDIKSSKSQGVGYMKVFCYDLMLMELGASKERYPNFLVHDSTIFDGVDERQIARALMLAKLKSEDIGFQYICLMNSDMIPHEEFDEEFSKIFNDSIVLRLEDETENGGLLGIRF